MKRLLKYIFIIVLTYFSIINVYASTNTYNRNELENYGVNKNIDVQSKLKYILKTKAVNADEKIYDFANILTDEEEQQLKTRIDRFILENNMDMVIVTDSFSYTFDRENEEYADDFYDYNDFGMKYEHNSGVLLLRNNNPSDKYYHMSTSGDAQLYLNDDRIDRILDEIYNDIHNERYLQAFTSFVDKVDRYVKEGKPSTAENYYIDHDGNIHRIKGKYHPPLTIAAFAGFVVALIIVLILVAKNKMVKKATRAEEYLNKDSINITRSEDKFLRSHTTSYTVSSSSGGHSSGGGHSFHSGSSGFSHGGGGRHG